MVVRVLLVEDEQTDRVFLGNIIEAGGHQVYFAPDGEQAFKTYMRKSIDVVVTDLLMPNVDGMEFIVSLKTLFPSAPVVAISGQGPELLFEAKNKGACVTLAKPVDPQELLEAIAKVAPDSSVPPLPRSKLVLRSDHRLLDEFEFEYEGQVRCTPAGGKLVDWLARTTEPVWDIRLDGTSIGQVEANLEETTETVRKAATKLVDELPVGWAREKSAYGALANAVLQQKAVTPDVVVLSRANSCRLRVGLVDDGEDICITDILYDVGPRLVVHYMAVGDLGLHRFVAHIDSHLATLDEVHRFVRVGVLVVLFSCRQGHFHNPEVLVAEELSVMVRGNFTWIDICHVAPPPCNSGSTP